MKIEFTNSHDQKSIFVFSRARGYCRDTGKKQSYTAWVRDMEEKTMSGKKTGIQEPAPVKRKKTGLIIAILCVLLVVAAGIVSTQMHNAARLYGELEWENVRLTVDQKVANSFYVKIANKSSTKMNFGWVDPSTAILQTTKGTYSQKVRKEVPSRTDSFLYLFFPNARGVPQSLSFEAVGKNLGATSSVKMDFSLSGEGENAIGMGVYLLDFLLVYQHIKFSGNCYTNVGLYSNNCPVKGDYRPCHFQESKTGKIGDEKCTEVFS